MNDLSRSPLQAREALGPFAAVYLGWMLTYPVHLIGGVYIGSTAPLAGLMPFLVVAEEQHGVPAWMPRLERTMNGLADTDAGWWPFLHLRPARHERMDTRCLRRLSLHYGTLMGPVIYAWYVFVGFLPLSPFWPIACVLASMAFFFVVVKYTFAIFWNRRAAQLAGQSGTLHTG